MSKFPETVDLAFAKDAGKMCIRDSSKDGNYRELYLALLEATAKLCRVSKYRIYTLEQLQEAVYGKLYRLHGMDIPAFVQVISRDVLI